LGGVTNGDLPKHLWNEVMQSSEDGETETLYRTALQVEYPTKLCSVSNFSCQLVDDPCLQSNVILSLNDTTDLITVNLNSDPLVFGNIQGRIISIRVLSYFHQIESFHYRPATEKTVASRTEFRLPNYPVLHIESE
jgi:hypothetical protein